MHPSAVRPGKEAHAADAGREWDMCPVLEVWVHPEADAAMIVLAGALTAASAAEAGCAIAQAVEHGSAELIIDLRDVEILERAGLEVLAGALPRPNGSDGPRWLVPAAGRPPLETGNLL